jgi:hypothetical protein
LFVASLSIVDVNHHGGIFFVNIWMVRGKGIYPFALTEEARIMGIFNKKGGAKLQSVPCHCFWTLYTDPTRRTTTHFPSLDQATDAECFPCHIALHGHRRRGEIHTIELFSLERPQGYSEVRGVGILPWPGSSRLLSLARQFFAVLVIFGQHQGTNI